MVGRLLVSAAAARFLVPTIAASQELIEDSVAVMKARGTWMLP
jgi:hypothetical protein